MTMKTLEDQLNAKADAETRRKIDERLDPIRQHVSRLPEIVFPATAIEYDPKDNTVHISMRPIDLLNLVADAAFINRRDQARKQRSDNFLERVSAAGIDI